MDHFANELISQLNWLISSLANQQIDSLAHQLISSLTNQQIDSLANRLIN